MKTTESFQFSSKGLPPDEAYEQYVLLYSRGSDVSRGKSGFEASVRAWRLNGVLLFERELSGVIHQRSDRAGNDGFDHLVLTLVLAGTVTGSLESGFRRAGPGDIYLADTRRRSRTEFDRAHVITASVAREVVRAAIGNVTGLHGRLLQAPDNLVLADYLQSLVRHGDALAQKVLPGLSRAMIDILGSALEIPGRVGAEGARQEVLRRMAVDRAIQERLSDRGLSVEDVARVTGLSRSALYRLLENEGGIARLIQRHRLDALRQALDSRDPAGFDDLAQRFGFIDRSQMNRLFLGLFGQSLQDYREMVETTTPGDAADSRRRWEGWMPEVS